MPYLYNGIELVLPPPKGYVIDLDNPQRSKVMEHYVVCAVGGTLAALAIIQRFYTKIFLLRGLHLDDGQFLHLQRDKNLVELTLRVVQHSCF